MPPPDFARWFAEHLQPHESSLRAYLHARISPSDVDDIVQETYARVLRVWARGPVESPRGLLFATARNLARDTFRRHTIVRILPIAEIDDSRVFDDAPSAAETVSRRQEAAMLDTAIAALPPRCREILLLRTFECLSHREIARRLGIAEHTVEAQLTKGLHRCAEYFVKHGAVTGRK